MENEQYPKISENIPQNISFSLSSIIISTYKQCRHSKRNTQPIEQLSTIALSTSKQGNKRRKLIFR